MLARGRGLAEYDRRMDAGFANLIHKMDGILIAGEGEDASNGESYFQVLKAIEAAELALQAQARENERLKSELQATKHELENYRSDVHSAVGSSDVCKHVQGSQTMENSNSAVRGKRETVWTGEIPVRNPPGTMVVRQGILPDNTSLSQLPSASRNLNDVEYNLGTNLLTHGMTQVPEGSNMEMLCNQEVVPKIREREEEIIQLRKHIADYAMKEAQIHIEKCLLEKKISYMRTAFDQQQQDLVDAASRALSYRQDIIKENIRLTYALQVAEQERSIFVTSLLPLLAEYDLQPHVLDAQSIVSNLKILIQHLRERVNLSENKLKESQYLLVPWQTGQLSNPSFPSQSPPHLRSGLDVMPQKTAVSSPISLGALNHWEASESHQHQLASEHLVPKSVVHNDRGPSSSGSSSKNAVPNSILSHRSAEVSTDALQRSEDYIEKSLINSSAAGTARETPNFLVTQDEKGTSMHWSSVNAAVATSATEDPTSSYYSPYLPPVFEEPSSSCSEAAEDDSLPAIEGLQITGEAFPGQEIQACGLSVHGTSTCNFAWIREAEDGSVTYITGANQPEYVVTADDVDSRLAIEIIPMDNQRRKGELIREFANDKRKITCDPLMQQEIEKILSAGHFSFSVSLSSSYMGAWESAVLNVKSHGYTIKSNESRGAITKKFSDSITITIPYGHATEFLIKGRNEQESILRAQDNWYRDIIVLTFRLFQKRAVQFKRKGKKKVLFF